MVEDVTAKYFNVPIQDAINVSSLNNALVFIYTAGLVMAVILSILLSDINRSPGIFASYLAGFLSIFIMAILSLAFLTVYYPSLFSAMNIGLALIYPNYYCMLFVVYIANPDTYFIIMFILIYVQALIYLGILGAFNGKKKLINKTQLPWMLNIQ